MDILRELQEKFGASAVMPQATRDEVPTAWATGENVHDILRYLKTDTDRPYRMLYDLTAIDERVRGSRKGQPDSDFTMVYHPSVRHSVLAAAKLSETLECCAAPFPMEIQPL